mgnify:CR=1 FL=1
MSTLRTDPVAEMATAAEAEEVVLLNFLKLRGKAEEDYIFAVEGGDDVTFYRTITKRVNHDITYRFFDCGGKDNVLSLFKLLSGNSEGGIEFVRFFVDRDFDDLKEAPESPLIYMTPSYSFENLLVNEGVLKCVLEGEFRCNQLGDDRDIDAVVTLFNELLEIFLEQTKNLNFSIYTCRVRKLKTNNLDELTKDKISVAIKKVNIRLTDEYIAENILKVGRLEDSVRVELFEEFSKLSPQLRWRGKYIYTFFTDFLSVLKDDRGKKQPEVFMRKARMTFNPKTDAVRAFTAVCDIPECLREFLASVPSDRRVSIDAA